VREQVLANFLGRAPVVVVGRLGHRSFSCWSAVRAARYSAQSRRA
jgi:hypothetical protein